jgi:hypothetical protein
MENKKEFDKMENQTKIETEENRKDTFDMEKVSTENCEFTGE